MPSTVERWEKDEMNIVRFAKYARPVISFYRAYNREHNVPLPENVGIAFKDDKSFLNNTPEILTLVDKFRDVLEEAAEKETGTDDTADYLVGFVQQFLHEQGYRKIQQFAKIKYSSGPRLVIRCTGASESLRQMVRFANSYGLSILWSHDYYHRGWLEIEVANRTEDFSYVGEGI